MKKLKFTKYKNWQKHNNPYNWEQSCEFCKESFREDEKFIRIDVENGIFRGDDEVFCFHKKCYNKGLEKLKK